MIKSNKGQINNIVMYVTIFLLVGFMVALGVIVNDKFSYAVKDSVSVVEQLLGNGSHTLTNTPVVRISSAIDNNSADMISYVTLVDETAGSVTIIVNNETKSYFNLTYVYKSTNVASASLDNTTSAITPITSDWLAILIIVMIVGVVLTLIISAFSFYNRRN